jgi:uncharacterized protein (DUF58 family)
MKRNRAGYLIILFLALVYIYFDGGFFPYTLFFITLTLPVMSFVYLVIVYNTFKYSERLDKREYQKGDLLDYTLQIYNVTPLQINYFTVYMHIDGQRLIRGMRNEHFTLKPFDRRQFHFNVPVLYRGKYKVGISHIEVRDFLNMFSLKYYPDEPKLIRVFPRILSVEQVDLPYVRISENEYLSQNKNAGNTEIENIREYMYGDSLKKIHWKLSSKFNKWIAKDTNAACEKEFWILLNLEKIDGDMEYALKIEDRTIEILVSVARLLLNSGITVKLCFFRREQVLISFSDANGFEQLYELLAFIPFDQKTSFDEVLDYFIESISEKQSVMIFSPVICENHLENLNKMSVKGHDISLFYCEAFQNNNMTDEIEKVLEMEMSELGINIINMMKTIHN